MQSPQAASNIIYIYIYIYIYRFQVFQGRVVLGLFVSDRGCHAIDPPIVDPVTLLLFECVRRGRARGDEITMFKSVGHAIEDLVAAAAVYEGLLRERASERV
jgi:hypothetical protein